MKKITTIFLVFLVAACATSPKDITAAYVSPLKYADYDCEQIAMESANVERRVNTLYANLEGNAKGDKGKMAVGMILFWPALFFIDGDSPEGAEYSQLKGEYNALQTAAVAKKCRIDFQGQFE
jgi:hypothetical protein